MTVGVRWFLYLIAIVIYFLGWTCGDPAKVQPTQRPTSPSSANSTCLMSEFRCSNGRCVPLNKFCDNRDDCGDGSDELRFCTPCNRTFYGDVDKTYSLDLHRPREDKLPYICHLTFTANGGAFGDLVQLTFDSFTVGRFTSFTQDGCPDGSMQISEEGRPQMGGSWCGTAWGPSIYYGETKSVTISVFLFRLNKDQNGYNFDFRMEYKMLRKDDANVRFGGIRKDLYPNITELKPPFAEPDYYLGELITGTYCSRIYSECDKRACRLQSPNFPGVYPRNLTCYFAVRQHDVPTGKHAIITVRQQKGQLISIRSTTTHYTPDKPRLRTWSECDDVQDYVTIYDGYTTRDPALLRFCGGGEPVPDTTSSGHEILVEFTTSPFGTFLQPSGGLKGFQLDVEVRFVDKESPSYSKNKHQCEFWLKGTDRGILESPLHSLTQNTTCLYHLQGMDTSVSPSPALPPYRPRYDDWRRSGSSLSPLPSPLPRFRIWLSVLKFHVPPAFSPEKPDQTPCHSSLNVWDGQLRQPSTCNDLFCNKEKIKTSSRSRDSRNVTLLARYCQNYIPKSCDHYLLTNGSRLPRPCNLAESFMSSADTMTVELKLSESTSLRPVMFRALYEFVDLHIDGEPYGIEPCSRRFVVMPSDDGKNPNRFAAPRNVFLYGRGGAKNLSCVYRFEAKKDEKVKITLTKVVIKNRDCRTGPNSNTERLHCYGNNSATLKIFEVPWSDIPGVQRDCFCSHEEEMLPFEYVSTSQVIELRFEVKNMSPIDDFENLYFEGNWRSVKMPSCGKKMKKSAASGILTFYAQSKSADEIHCENYPMAIYPTSHHYLYVKVHGVPIQISPYGNTTSIPWDCRTDNRIVVHSGGILTVVCPAHENSAHSRFVEVFSAGWKKPVRYGARFDRLGFDASRAIIVDFIGKTRAQHSVMWLELSKRKWIVTHSGLSQPEDCPFKCPELDACINSSVWCDGISHCPSGYDEAFTHCSFLFKLPPLYLFIGALFIASACSAAAFYLYRKCRRRPQSILQARLKSLSSDTTFIEEKGIIC